MQENVCLCTKSRRENVFKTLKSRHEKVFICKKRKIEKVLQSWVSDTSHKPLVVKGVRQCDKTSSVMDFATNNFKHVAYLDFREHPDYKKFFTPNLEVDSINAHYSSHARYGD